MSRYGILSPVGICRIVSLSLLLLNIGCVGTNGWAMNKSGMRQYARGHYAQARHKFAEAIAHNPRNPDYRHNLAMALQKQGDPVASEKILRHNLTIDAMHQPTYHSLTQLMIAQGRNAEAQDLLAGWVATQPYVPEANIEMAWYQKQTGDYPGAEMSLQQALKTKPGHPVALAQLGELYQTTGRNDLAVAYYQRSLASNWDQPEVQSRLATLSDPNMGPRSRSAMMQEVSSAPLLADLGPISTDEMMADGPVLAGSPTMVSYMTPVSDPMISGAPMMASDVNFQAPLVLNGAPQVAMAPPTNIAVPFGNDPEAVALEDLRSNPVPKRHHTRKKGKQKDPVMATYPLPNFDAPTTAWVPSGSIPGQPSMSYQVPASFDSTIVSDGTGLSTYGGPIVAGGTYSPTPINEGTQGLVPMADPAHFYGAGRDMTASLPVVDPH